MAEISYYTSGPMLKTDIDSVTSAASGFPKEYLTDNNPDTWWKKSSGSGTTQDIKMDNNQEVNVDTLVLFIHNYKDVGANPVWLYHDDNPDFSSNTVVVNGLPILDTSTPIRIYELSSSSSERYWRLRTANADIQISMVLLCQKWTVTQGREFPITDTDDFATRILAAPGGRQHVILQNKNIFGSRTDKFSLSGTTNYEQLRSAFADCKGNAFPIIRQPGSTNVEAEIGRISRAKFIRTESDYQYYQPTITIDLMSYIDSGEAY